MLQEFSEVGSSPGQHNAGLDTKTPWIFFLLAVLTAICLANRKQFRTFFPKPILH